MNVVWSILLEEARWPFRVAFYVTILLLILAVTGCAVTPDMEDDCPDHFTEQEDIIKCKKRVLHREDRAFEAAQLQSWKDQCEAQERVWLKVGYNESCVDREVLHDLFY